MKIFGGMSPDRLGELLAAFGRLRIGVLGDFFLDKYLDVDGSWAERSIESGKTAHQVVGIRHSPGAAGTVVCNLAALGAGRVWAIGLTGEDGESYELHKDLAALGCNAEHLHQDPQRATPTYLKPRERSDPSLAGEHERYDTKNRTPTSAATVGKIVRSLDALLPQLDALIIADQVEEEDCGVVTAAVREVLADRAKRHPQVVFWADSRRRIRQFRQVIIKPNQFEAVGRENPLPGDEVGLAELQAAMIALRAVTGAPLCVTRGAAGMVVSDPEIISVPGVRLSGPTDPTGAGDSATAGAVLALAAGAELAEAALMGNLVASITVEQLATTGTARPDQLPPRLQLWQTQRSRPEGPGAGAG
jgi:bifunctional ADP-heptose synthase (sugar kinase/adenylyltransferase)